MKFIIFNEKSFQLNEFIEFNFKEDNFNQNWLINIQNFIRLWIDSSLTIEVKTSGSIGIPKIYNIEKEKLLKSAKRTIQFFEIKQNQNLLLCLPIDSIAAKLMIVRALVTNANLILQKPQANPLQFNKHKIDFAAMTPYQVQHSLQYLNQIKTLIIGGSQTSFTLEQKLQKVNTNCFATYGMTETLTHIAVRKLNKNIEKYFTTLSHITIKTDSQNKLIINDEQLQINNLKTNDIVKIKNPNQFYFLGRADNIINSGGIKIQPEVIEKKINKFIKTDFYIGSQSNEILGQECVLILSTEISENDKKELLKKLRENLKKYEIPKKIIFRKIKKTKTGKIIRERLKK